MSFIRVPKEFCRHCGQHHEDDKAARTCESIHIALALITDQQTARCMIEEGKGADLIQVALGRKQLEDMRAGMVVKGMLSPATLPSPTLEQMVNPTDDCGRRDGRCARSETDDFPCTYHTWELDGHLMCVFKGRVWMRNSVELLVKLGAAKKEKPGLADYYRERTLHRMERVDDLAAVGS